MEIILEGVGCCSDPRLKFDWKLGSDDLRLVLGIESVSCKNCGMGFLFETTNGNSCPLLSLSSNHRGVLLQIVKNRLQ